MKKKRVLFLVNHDVVIYNFRLEVVEKLIEEGHEVHISSPYGERIDDLVALGAKFHEIVINRHGMNPIAEVNLLRDYQKLLKKVKPDIVLGFTIKPNIYGAIAARQARIPFVSNITGLGTAVENGGWKQKLFVSMYKYAFKDIQRVFFQNTENQQFFVDNKIAVGKHMLIPGSGVNLNRFNLRAYPNDENGVVRFAFISRIMKEKGIDYYLKAAKTIKEKTGLVYLNLTGCFFSDEQLIVLANVVANSNIANLVWPEPRMTPMVLDKVLEMFKANKSVVVIQGAPLEVSAIVNANKNWLLSKGRFPSLMTNEDAAVLKQYAESVRIAIAHEKQSLYDLEKALEAVIA